MALAARCPHCRALFRVIADQLKLRGGLVRCGECRHVFDAIGSLSYVDDRSLPREQNEAPIGGAALAGPRAAAARRSAQPPVRSEPTRAHAGTRPQAERARHAMAAADPIRDELSVPTLIGSPESNGPGGREDGTAVAARIEPHLAAARAPADYAALLEADDAAAAPAEAELDEPEALSFLPTGDEARQQRITQVLGAACIPLALLAIVQFGLAVRSDALEAWPKLRPMLTRGCHWFGCSVAWPQHAELLTIVGSELAAIPGTDVIELNAAVRSRAPFVMALPAIEVTLTDTQNRTIARKVFLPVDYLASAGEPSSRIDEGLVPGSDLSVRLVFEARGLSASGFVLYPFYL